MINGLEVLICGLILVTFFLLIYKGVLFNRDFVNRPFISLLLVVQNQEEVIEGIIKQIYGLHGKTSFPFEVVVLDLASRDQTKEIVKRLSSRYPLILVEGMENGTFALESATFYCQGDLIGILDLQGRIHPNKIIPALKSLLCPI